jgi:hypothetical protein
LQGFFELSEITAPSTRQTQIIKDHLALVFIKETPDRQEGYMPLTTRHTGNSAQRLCGIQKQPTYCSMKSEDEILDFSPPISYLTGSDFNQMQDPTKK